MKVPVLILKDQRCQIGDPAYAELLGRLRIRNTTPEDLNLLYSRIAITLPNHNDLPIVVRRHAL
jgi:hypothetical protein